MFEFELQPRLSETDGMGHIGNTCLPAWFEESRADLFEIFNPGLTLEGWNLILKKYEIEIHRQIRHGRPVKITTVVDNVGTKSFTTRQAAYQNGNLVATALTVLVYFNYQAGVTEKIPGHIRERLLQHAGNGV